MGAARPLHAAQLHLFAPAGTPPRRDDAGPISAACTLGQFATRYYLPLVLGPRTPKPRTLDQVAESLDLWATLTGDPPLSAIDQATAAAFVAALCARPGRRGPISPNTAIKHARTLQPILDAAGRRDRRNPDAAGLLSDVPYLRTPRPRRKPPLDSFTMPEITAWLDACRHARTPHLAECSPADWWRALIRTAYNTGWRIATLLAFRRCWCYTEPHGATLATIPEAAHKGQGERLYLVPPAALEAMAALPTGDLVFPWPHWLTWLHAERRRLLDLAGLPPARRFGFHGLRKALATALFALDPGAARLQLGHSAEATTRTHYAHPAAAAPALAAIPQP